MSEYSQIDGGEYGRICLKYSKKLGMYTGLIGTGKKDLRGRGRRHTSTPLAGQRRHTPPRCERSNGTPISRIFLENDSPGTLSEGARLLSQLRLRIKI